MSIKIPSEMTTYLALNIMLDQYTDCIHVSIYAQSTIQVTTPVNPFVGQQQLN